MITVGFRGPSLILVSEKPGSSLIRVDAIWFEAVFTVPKDVEVDQALVSHW